MGSNTAHMARRFAYAILLSVAVLGAPTVPEFEELVPETTTLMHAIDTNKNGVVESAEFVATGETQEQFSQLDLNGDGVLDADERASALVGKLIQRRAAAAGSSAKSTEFVQTLMKKKTEAEAREATRRYHYNLAHRSYHRGY